MKATIRGMRYNTEIAALIGASVSGTGDRQVRESLYKTPRRGHFFLAASGGAQSRYARRDAGGEWTPGERIVPLTDHEAYSWACKNDLSASIIESHFPAMLDVGR